MTNLLLELSQGRITPTAAVEEAMRQWQLHVDQCTEKWSSHHERLLEVGDQILEYALEVLVWQRYEPCRKAGFFAALYSSRTLGLDTPIESTRPPDGVSPCQFGETCVRIASGVEGDRYDNCPSVHAAQWLKEAEYDWPGTYLWMEAGAVLVDVGTETERYVLAGGNDQPYRCSMCLKTMAGKGIMDVCRVGQDAEGQVTLHFAPVVATLDCLMVCNVAGMMAE